MKSDAGEKAFIPAAVGILLSRSIVDLVLKKSLPKIQPYGEVLSQGVSS